MLLSRNIKCLFFLFLFTIFLIYGHYYSFGQSSPGAYVHQKDKCRKGIKCTGPFPTTALPKTQTSKPTAKKNLKVLHLEKIHILPKANQEYELVDVSVKVPNSSSFHGKIKVLIISYLDYGLPQIGDILTRHRDIFYLNEPLYPFDSASFKDGEEPISRRYISEAIDYLTELFDCKIFDSKFGYSEDILKRTTKHAFSACKRNQRNVTECVETSCRSKKIVMSKVISVYLQDLQSFIMRNKGKVKVLIIQRDPRVNLHLHNKKFHPGWTTGSDMFFQGRSLCSRMLHDVQTAKRLEGSGNSNLYRIVLYEHFLKSPEVMIKNILSFLGVENGSEKVKKMLRNSNAQKDIRKAKLSKWDSIPDDDAALSVDKACAFFYKHSLYNPMRQSMGFIQRYNLCQYCD